jgi:iron-sulfur cluster assembly protein
MTTTQTNSAQIILTPSALAKVREFIAAEQDLPADTVGLRIGVLPGGCSGFKYEMSIDEAPGQDDAVIDIEGVRVFVDSFSAPHLAGVKIDYVTTMQSSGFAFENPNATGGCGCGTSFSV